MYHLHPTFSMRHIRLTLEGYKNFHLRGIKKLVYTPTEKTQIILGSNGSGKTSLLKELSPLPADHRLYLPHGSKIIEIEHGGSSYVLSSIFSPDGHRYLFVKDGEELNPGESITVYRELVKAHFKYTQDLHDLFIGVESFDTLEVSKRRSLFMRMSDQDYSYAVKYYKKLTESARDLQGSIRLDKAKLVKERDKLLSKEDEEKVRASIEEARELVKRLMDIRIAKLPNHNSLRAEVEDLETSVMETSMRLSRLSATISEGMAVFMASEGSKSLPEVIDKIRNDLTAVQATISNTCQRLERLETTRGQAANQSQSKIEYEELKIKELTATLEACFKELHIPVRYQDPRFASEVLPVVVDYVESYYEQKDIYGVLDANSPSYQDLRSETQILTDRLGVIEKTLEDYRKKLHTLEHYKSKGETECPECHHSWIPNYDPAQVYRLETEIKELVIEQEQRTARKEYCEKQSRIIEHHAAVNCALKDIANRYPTLVPLFDWLREKHESVFDWLRDLRLAMTDLPLHLKMVQLSEKREEHVKSLRTRNYSSDVTIDVLDTEIAEIQASLATYQARHTELTEKYHRYSKLHSAVTAGQQAVSDLIKAGMNRDQGLIDITRHAVSGVIDELLMAANLKLTSLERSITTIDIEKTVIHNLEKSIETKEMDHKLLKFAAAALSPTEGLIAKGMAGFINRFVRDVNNFIENFWLYPLALEAVDMENDEVDLDYKFMVRVNGDHVVKDIKEASRGQREIINLAMYAVCMEYHHLQGYPLFLDEFATRMDPAHRKAAYEAIDKLIESDKYSQIFLVSHYQEGYGALTDSEVMVLCDSNVRMPKDLDFNKHVVMTV